MRASRWRWIEPVVLDHINVKRKLKGKGEWQDIEITLFDPIVPSGAQQVMEWVRTSHESDGAFDFKDVAAFAPLVDFFADFFAEFFFFFGRLRPLQIHRRNAA